MYVETEVGGKKLQGMVDTAAETVYMAKELAIGISLHYRMEKGYVKGVTTKSLPTYGVAGSRDI